MQYIIRVTFKEDLYKLFNAESTWIDLMCDGRE